MKLSGKCSIITGAARGIGRASVHGFVEEGAKVALFDIDEAGMKETVATAPLPGQCLALRVDVSSERSVEEGVRRVLAEFGQIDILFSNAAHNRDFKPALETTEADWDRELNVTLKGAFLCAKHSIPHMIAKGGGSIILTASYLAFTAYPGFFAYCAAKGGLVQLGRSLAVDYSPRGVRVNTICPGPVDTPAFDSVRDQPAIIEQICNLTLLRRLARSDEIAKVAVFLASDDSSYMTGSVMVVDGGALARLG